MHSENKTKPNTTVKQYYKKPLLTQYV